MPCHSPHPKCTVQSTAYQLAQILARTDVNATSMATNPTGEALIKAAEEGRTDDVKALLKAGADVHAVDEVPPGPPARPPA